MSQAYAPQGVDDFYQNLGYNCSQQNNQIYAEPVIQQHQMYRDPTVQQHIYTEHLIPQHTHIYREDIQKLNQIYRAEDIQQDSIYREVREEEQPSPQPATQAHVRDICNKTFMSSSGFKAHYAGHTGEKAHICDVCHKGFTREFNLRRHYLIHTGDKPHVCEVCNKCFNQKGHLHRHYFTHPTYKPHVSEVCNKSFTRKRSLKHHRCIHIAQRPHVCNICQQGFFYKSSLRIHYHKHSEDREGKRKKRIGNKNAEEAEEQQDQMLIAISEPGLEQKLQEFYMEHQVIHVQTEPHHCEIFTADNSGYYEQALMHSEQQVYSENDQALATINQPLTHMVHQALNIDTQNPHPLMTVGQQCIDHLRHQTIKQIGQTQSASNWSPNL